MTYLPSVPDEVVHLHDGDPIVQRKLLNPLTVDDTKPRSERERERERDEVRLRKDGGGDSLPNGAKEDIAVAEASGRHILLAEVAVIMRRGAGEAAGVDAGAAHRQPLRRGKRPEVPNRREEVVVLLLLVVPGRLRCLAEALAELEQHRPCHVAAVGKWAARRRNVGLREPEVLLHAA